MRGMKGIITLQNVAEFWNVLTRPVDKNGMGLSVERAEEELEKLESTFQVLYEDVYSHRHWESLLKRHQIKGVSVHDARLVSVMLAQNITHILTFDTGDFARYTEITAIHPTDLAEGAFVLG